MRSAILSVVLVMSLVISGVASATSARVGTWNTMRLGHGEKKSYDALAEIASNVDILAVQEVMNDEGLNALKSALEKRTHEKWDVLASSPVGSKSYKEMYAFIYRESAIQYVDGAVSYLDKKRIFIREPFSAKFRSKSDGSEFALASLHVIYGQSAEDRKPELAELGNYWAWLEEVYEGAPIILTGDFNMSPTDPAFNALRQYAVPLVSSGASTLSGVDGRFANLYDNVWMSPKNHHRVTAIGVVDYPRMLGITHEQARATVSDHAPIFFQMGTATLSSKVLMTTGAVRTVNKSVAQMTPANDSTYSTKPVATRLASSDPAAASGPVRGNRNSHIYHRAQGCPSYNAISAKNRVDFASEDDAKAQGYRVAGNCD